MVIYILIFLLSISILDTAHSRLENDTLYYKYEDTTEIYIENISEQSEDDSQLLDAIEADNVNKVKSDKTSVALRSRFSRKLQIPIGYTNGKYFGTPIKSYHRLKYERNEKYSTGLLLEKDAGERYINDFTNGFLQAKNFWFFKSLILGDYVVEAGQGLVLWRGYDFRKGSVITASTYRVGKELKPHLSADENGFLRGAAASFDISRLQMILFYSSRFLSASIDTNRNVTNISSTGYFRTESELAKRANLKEVLYGGRLTYSNQNIHKLGFTAYLVRYDKNLYLSEGKTFSGYKFADLGFDYIYNYKNINLFGEIALNVRKNSSLICGILIAPSSKIKLLSLFRNYLNTYYKRYANPFGERSSGANERGYYLGIQFVPLNKIIINAYYDEFMFPISKSVKYPVNGSEKFIQLETRTLKNFTFYLRYRQKILDKKSIIIDKYNRTAGIVDVQDKNNYRINADYYLNRNFRLRFRFEYQTVEAKNNRDFEVGRLFYQELVYRGLKKIVINWRISWFKTDSYLSGIGHYENDLPGVLSIPILYGKGVKWYLLLRYKIVNTIEASAKYSYLIREDVKKIGSGWEQLPSNYDNRIGLQLDLKY